MIAPGGPRLPPHAGQQHGQLRRCSGRKVAASHAHRPARACGCAALCGPTAAKPFGTAPPKDELASLGVVLSVGARARGAMNLRLLPAAADGTPPMLCRAGGAAVAAAAVGGPPAPTTDLRGRLKAPGARDGGADARRAATLLPAVLVAAAVEAARGASGTISRVAVWKAFGADGRGAAPPRARCAVGLAADAAAFEKPAIPLPPAAEGSGISSQGGISTSSSSRPRDALMRAIAALEMDLMALPPPVEKPIAPPAAPKLAVGGGRGGGGGGIGDRCGGGGPRRGCHCCCCGCSLPPPPPPTCWMLEFSASPCGSSIASARSALAFARAASEMAMLLPAADWNGIASSSGGALLVAHDGSLLFVWCWRQTRSLPSGCKKCVAPARVVWGVMCSYALAIVELRCLKKVLYVLYATPPPERPARIKM